MSFVQAHGSGVGAMGVGGDEVDQVMVEEFFGPEAAVEEILLGEDGAGIHLIVAAVLLFEGFHRGQGVEVGVAFHMGEDGGIAVGAEVLKGVADLLFGGRGEELDKDGHGLVQGGNIAFVQEAGGGFGVEDLGADVELEGRGVLGAPGGGFLQAGEVLCVGEGFIARGDVGGADEVAGALGRGLGEEGEHAGVVLRAVIYVADYVGVHFDEHGGSASGGFLAKGWRQLSARSIVVQNPTGFCTSFAREPQFTSASRTAHWADVHIGSPKGEPRLELAWCWFF